MDKSILISSDNGILSDYILENNLIKNEINKNEENIKIKNWKLPQFNNDYDNLNDVNIINDYIKKINEKSINLNNKYLDLKDEIINKYKKFVKINSWIEKNSNLENLSLKELRDKFNKNIENYNNDELIFHFKNIIYEDKWYFYYIKNNFLIKYDKINKIELFKINNVHSSEIISFFNFEVIWNYDLKSFKIFIVNNNKYNIILNKKLKKEVKTIKFIPNFKKIIIIILYNDDEITLYDVEEKKEINNLKIINDIDSLVVHPDGKILGINLSNKNSLLYNIETNEIELELDFYINFFMINCYILIGKLSDKNIIYDLRRKNIKKEILLNLETKFLNSNRYFLLKNLKEIYLFDLKLNDYDLKIKK